MRLLDDVRLIESEILAPLIVSTFERSIDRARGQQVMNSAILESCRKFLMLASKRLTFPVP